VTVLSMATQRQEVRRHQGTNAFMFSVYRFGVFFSVKSTCKPALKWHFTQGDKLTYGWGKSELKQRLGLGEARLCVLYHLLYPGLQTGSALRKTRHLGSSIEACCMVSRWKPPLGQSCKPRIPLCSLLRLRVGGQESNRRSYMVQLHRGGKLMFWPHPGSLQSFVGGELHIWRIHRGQHISL